MKTLIWRLSFENRYMNLHKELEEKLQLMGKTTTDESNDESITNVQSRKLLSIVAKNIQGSSQTGKYLSLLFLVWNIECLHLLMV